MSEYVMKNENIARGVARGHTDRPCLRRVVVAFDDETFSQIRDKAISSNTSFAEQVRQLVEWGLEA